MLFDYRSKRLDELSLKKGERVHVVEKSGDGWWKGQILDRQGWFPSNFVSTTTAEGNNNSNKTQEPDPPERSLRYRALYRFAAQNEDELSFEKGDKLELLEDPDKCSHNWLKARNGAAAFGVVPRNFIAPEASDAKRLSAASVDRSSHRSSSGGRKSGSSSEGSRVKNGGDSNGHDQALADQQSTVLDETRLQSDPGSSPERPWYFGRLSRSECDDLLNAYGVVGDFLVRDSETGAPGDYSVSLRAYPRNKHFKAHRLDDGALSIGSRQFDSLEAIIEHYRRVPICTLQSGEKLYLKKPLDDAERRARRSGSGEG